MNLWTGMTKWCQDHWTYVLMYWIGFTVCLMLFRLDTHWPTAADREKERISTVLSHLPDGCSHLKAAGNGWDVVELNGKIYYTKAYPEGIIFEQ